MTKALWRRAFEVADVVLRPGGVFLCENPARTELAGCATHCASHPRGDMEVLRPGLFKTTVSYCHYSTPEATYSQKPTCIWSNVDLKAHGLVPRYCCAATRCAVGRVREETGKWCHDRRMSFDAWSFRERRTRGNTHASEWGSMPAPLLVDLRAATERALASGRG